MSGVDVSNQRMSAYGAYASERAIAAARPSRTRKKPSAVRSPVMNSASYGSTSLVSSAALSASVRETSTVGTPSTSAARRAAFSVRTKWLVGTSTLPPRWPHFFSDASWSSKCTPAAFSGPPKPASASATIGASQCVPLRPSDQSIWSARRSALFSRFASAGALFTGYRLWSGYVCAATFASAATCQPER